MKITPDHLKRHAIIYIRQSSPIQVKENLESQRRQYDLVNKAKEYGFFHIEVIDDDLGRSGSGIMERPGFSKMVALVCEGNVGAIFCIEASRLARNGRDWHHLIDLCSLVKTLVIDPDGIYDPLLTNDRLLLGMKGTMSEFELNLLKQRSLEALRQKAMRGELKFCIPVGFCWTHHNKIELEPDQRVQEAMHLVFNKFTEFRSARQVLLWFREENISLPKIHYDEFGQKILWDIPIYKTILSIVKNPFYAGAYAFGKTESRTKVVQGRARRTAGHRKPKDQWITLLKEHHDGYISWERYEENQKILLENTHMQKGENAKSGRGGRALLTGLLRCGHCSRMLHVVYSGQNGKSPQYNCWGAHINYGRQRCISFGSLRPDQAISSEILKAVEDDAIEASIKAAEQITQQLEAHRKALLLEREQALYEVDLSVRRYETVDPTNRLVAGELEKRWNQALERLKEVDVRLEKWEGTQQKILLPDCKTLFNLATDLSSVWSSPSTDNKLKQKIIRLLICEILVCLDKEKNELIFTIHWKGGRHSQLTVLKNKTGHHGRSNSIEAIQVIAQMALHFPDRAIATTLNRLGIKTGTGISWNKLRVRATRSYHNIPSYDPSKEMSKSWLTIEKAAQQLQVGSSTIRRLIQSKLISAKQVVCYAPWQIDKSELEKESVKDIIKNIKRRKKVTITEESLPQLPLLDQKNPILLRS